eukprot:10998047-Alexandrium_andersonii.AAC.1
MPVYDAKGKVVDVYTIGLRLVTFLRHDPNGRAGRIIDPAGWVSVEELLKQGSITKDYPDLDARVIEEVVEIDNVVKARFLMCRHEDMLYVRAAQGHSGKLEPYLKWALVME